MSTTLSDYGIELGLPAGWYGEIFRNTNHIADTGPTVHLANTPLILGDRNGYADEIRQVMRPGDAIVCVWNLPSLPNIIAVGGETVSPAQGWSLQGASDTPFHGVEDTQSSLRKAIHVAERVFDLIAFFGARPPPPRLVREIDSILATVRIDVSQRARGDRLEQYFSAADAVRIHEEVRREAWARYAPYASSEEVEEHRLAFPEGV
jgi:hypothetical protein